MNQNQSKTSHRGFIAFTIFQKTAHYIFLFLFTLFFKNYINYNIEDSYHYFGIFLYLIPIASITGGFISDYTNRTLIFHIGIWLAIIGLSIILFSGSGISLTVFVVSSFVMAIGLGFIHVMIITLIGINSEIRKTEKQNYIDLAWYFLAITSASFLVNILSQSGAFKEPAFKATALKIAVVSLLTGYIIWLIRNIKRNPFADVRPETKYKPAKPVLILFLVFIFISLMKISANQILSVHLSFNFHHTVHWNYDGTALIKLIITLIITIILSKRNGLNTNMIYRIFRSLFIIFPVLFTGLALSYWKLPNMEIVFQLFKYLFEITNLLLSIFIIYLLYQSTSNHRKGLVIGIYLLIINLAFMFNNTFFNLLESRRILLMLIFTGLSLLLLLTLQNKYAGRIIKASIS